MGGGAPQLGVLTRGPPAGGLRLQEAGEEARGAAGGPAEGVHLGSGAGHPPGSPISPLAEELAPLLEGAGWSAPFEKARTLWFSSA